MPTARTRANRRYNEKTYDRVCIQTKKGSRSRWKDAAAARGLSLAALIVEAVEAYIQMDAAAPPAPEPSEE